MSSTAKPNAIAPRLPASSARRRAGEWLTAVDELSASRVELDRLRGAFDGIETRGGEFRVHLELAARAIALTRRVLVLQAVEHAQLSEGNEFANFIRNLNKKQASIATLEVEIAGVLTDIGRLRLRPPSVMKRPVLTRGDVDDVLTMVERLRELGESATDTGGMSADMVIDIARHVDGSVVVFPAAAAPRTRSSIGDGSVPGGRARDEWPGQGRGRCLRGALPLGSTSPVCRFLNVSKQACAAINLV